MRFTQTTRLLAIAVLLLAATALIWWGVGFHVGSALLDGSLTWRRSFGFGPLGLLRLFALAIAVAVTLAVVASVPAHARWLSLAAIALGAVLLYGDQGRGDIIGVVLFVFAVAAVSESSGTPQILAAVGVAVVVAFASIVDAPLSTPQKSMAIVVRAVFFYTPLLLGPTYLERYALRRAAK
jgi:hypothetical protein